MKLELHDNAINTELWEWIGTMKNDLENVVITSIQSEAIIRVDFEYNKVHLKNNEISIIHNMNTQEQSLFFKDIIIEDSSIFENDFNLKHYPFLDQYFLNGTYVEMALYLEQIIEAFGGIN